MSWIDKETLVYTINYTIEHSERLFSTADKYIPRFLVGLTSLEDLKQKGKEAGSLDEMESLAHCAGYLKTQYGVDVDFKSDKDNFLLFGIHIEHLILQNCQN